MYFPLIVGVLYLFCYALLCVHSSFANILKRKRKLVVLRLVSFRCIVTIYVHKQPIIAIYFEFENELEFYSGLQEKVKDGMSANWRLRAACSFWRSDQSLMGAI